MLELSSMNSPISKRPLNRCRIDRAYTFIELLVVVVIIGLLAAVALQSLDSFRKRERVNAVALALYGWLQLVRQESLRLQGGSSAAPTSDSSCIVNFESGTLSPGQILASVDSSLSPTCSSQLGSNAQLKLTSMETRGAAVSASPSQPSVTFTPRTLSTNTVDVVIGIVVGSSSPQRCVKILAVSGGIDIGRNDQSAASSGSCSYSVERAF